MPETIKRILIYTLVFCMAYAMPYNAMAQRAGKLKKTGDASFENGDYYNAIKMYTAVLYDSPLVNKNPAIIYPFHPANHAPHKIGSSKKSLLQYKLAEAYRLCYHYKEAVPQYEQYLSSQDTKFPLARLWYGLCLLANNQPDKAITSLNTFLQKYRTVDSFAQKAKQGIVNSNFALAQKNVKSAALIFKLPSTVSADGSNFAFEKINDTSFLYTTSRHEIDKKKEKIYPVRLYTGSVKNATIKKVDGFPGSDMNMATSSLSGDGLTLYFTGWKETEQAKKTYYRIFYTTRTSVNAQWAAPVALSTPVNIEGFHSKQPFIAKDNQHLFFVSDRPGGFGKYDIWMVEMQGGKPIGHAVNAGSNVNTEGDEASPFYDAITRTLYFSSNGSAGMGGMDIFKINGDIVSGQWSGTAVNLGIPFNSVKDDAYYSKDANTDTAYLSSDRASTCCMEIFRVVPVPKRDTVIKYVILPEPKKVDTIIIAKDQNKRLMDSVNEVTVDRMYVNYRFASSRIRNADRPQLERIIQMLKKDPKLNMLVASFTDCIGSMLANQKISRKRSESVKAYLVANGIDPSRINIDFFGKKYFVLACKEDSSYHTEKQMANRRSDLIITTEKNPKWQPSGKELEIEKDATVYPKSPLHMVSIDESKKVNIDSIYKTTAERTIDKKLTDSMVTVGGNQHQGKSEGRSKYIIPKIDNSQTGNINAVKLPEANKTVSVNDKTEASGKHSKYFDVLKTNKPSEVKERNDAVTADKKNSRNARNNQTVTVDMNVKAIPEPYLNSSSSQASDTMPKTMKITELLDLTPRLKKPTIIEQMTSRTPKRSFEVFSTSDSVKVELYDNGVFDYDTVSVIYNKSLAVYKEMLRTNRPITFYVKLNTDPRKNEMIFFAENLGLTPPNSALMIITDGDKKRTEINVSSDLDHNSVIYFIKVKKNK